MDFPASSYYQQTANYEAEQQPFPSYDPQKNPAVTVTSYNPERGPQGSQVYVYIDSIYDLSVQTSITLNLMFATRLCQSQLTPLGPRRNTYQYVLNAEAPTFQSTGWQSPRVPLRVQIQDDSGLVETGFIGTGNTFYYTDGGNHQAQASPDDLSRKRKTLVDPPEIIRAPAKRASSQQLHSGVVEPYPSVPYTQSDSLAYLKTSPPDPLNPTPARSTPYSRSQTQRQYHQGDTSRRSSQNFSAAPTSAQSLMKAPSPQIPPWGAPYASVNHPARSPGLAASSVSRMASMSSPSSSGNPPLIRTSTLQQQSSSSSSSSAGGSFNPYGIFAHSRATLKINGDIDSMVDHWTPNEYSAKRRIVQFWRNQSGSEIHTNFEPVAPDDRLPSSTCISCILWEERRECFVTSVDTIFLLEVLIGIHFTVEEKNRIRRNLEGFRPMTVSKAKSDSENFFKVIMGFPNPKPRNIEKDVKVFPWKILAHALKKIVGKYVSFGPSFTLPIVTDMPSSRPVTRRRPVYWSHRHIEVMVTEVNPMPAPKRPPLLHHNHPPTRPFHMPPVSPRPSHPTYHMDAFPHPHITPKSRAFKPPSPGCRTRTPSRHPRHTRTHHTSR